MLGINVHCEARLIVDIASHNHLVHQLNRTHDTSETFSDSGLYKLTLYLFYLLKQTSYNIMHIFQINIYRSQ